MKGNVIQMNTLHLNSVRLNGIGKVQSVSLKGGSTEDPVFPPVEPPVEPTPTYTLSASVTNGKVSAKRNGSAVNLPFTANEGDTIVLEVTPNDGYTFEGWADGNTDNPRSITMIADVVLSAQCVEVVAPPVGKYIQFEDAEVERVLMANGVSSDGIGITIEDAEKVTSIGTWFRDNGLIKSFLELSLFSNLKKIGGDTLGYSAFYSCDQLQSLGFPENVESIGAYCLYQCNNLSIDVSRLPQSIKSLGGFAFQGVTTTGVLDLPNLEGTINWGNFNDAAAKQLEGIENLGAITSIAGFMKQEKLRYVNIPQTCNDIANNAFSGCIALEQVICRATTPPTLGTTVFSGSMCPIYVPDASLEAYKTATNWNQFADRIHPLSEIEGSPYIQFEDAEVERILMSKGVSSDGIGITKADAENVTSISNWFKGNTTIQTFDELKYFINVKAISSAYAFMDCTALQWVNCENIESINSQVFNNSGITELILPKVITIPNSGLVGMKKTTKVVIGASCTNIDANNIWSWNDKGKVSFIFEGATPPTFSTSNNKPDWYGVTFYVPDASVDAYKSAWSSWASRIKGISEYNG